MRAQFGDFSLDSASRQLLRRGEPVHLSRKAFDALCLLVERRPAAVPKEELHARLWPGTFVSDANLSVLVAELRRALDDDPQAPKYIRTVHRIGYAFCADLAGEETAPAPRRDRSPAWLVLPDRTAPLATGVNVIGRDPASDIWIDEPGVSRRHAQIRVEGTTATIEDLGSKNGTDVGDTPVTGPHVLVNGDQIRLGPLTLEFRTDDGNATRTMRIRK